MSTLEIKTDEDEVLAVVADEASIGRNDGSANVHERVESTSEALLVLLAVEADDNAVAGKILICDLHEVHQCLSVELATVGGRAVVEGSGVVDGRSEDDSGACSELGLLCNILGDASDLDSVLAELGQVARAKDGREEACLVSCVGYSLRRRSGREGQLAVVVTLVVGRGCDGEVAAEGRRDRSDIGYSERLCTSDQLLLLCRGRGWIVGVCVCDV